MSNNLQHKLVHHQDADEDTALGALNMFLDGELAVEDQPALFLHLSTCERCRLELEGVMRFRRLSRLEHLNAPPMLDAALFKRLQKHRVIMTRIDRARDRRPLWNIRTAVSLRATILTVLLVFLSGLFYPNSERSEYAVEGYVTGADERIEFIDLDMSRWNTRTLYVFYPGLTVEASSDEDRVDLNSTPRRVQPK